MLYLLDHNNKRLRYIPILCTIASLTVGQLLNSPFDNKSIIEHVER